MRKVLLEAGLQPAPERRHLEYVLCVYRQRRNDHRPHRAPRLLRPRDPTPLNAAPRLHHQDLLGGLIH